MGRYMKGKEEEEGERKKGRRYRQKEEASVTWEAMRKCYLEDYEEEAK